MGCVQTHTFASYDAHHKSKHIIYNSNKKGTKSRRACLKQIKWVPTQYQCMQHRSRMHMLSDHKNI